MSFSARPGRDDDARTRTRVVVVGGKLVFPIKLHCMSPNEEEGTEEVRHRELDLSDNCEALGKLNNNCPGRRVARNKLSTNHGLDLNANESDENSNSSCALNIPSGKCPVPSWTLW